MQREPITIGRYLKGRESRSNIGVRNWLGGIFGCQHREMSRPFSRQGETYRVCLTCGARREFIESTWETRGPFYFASARTGDVAATPEVKAQKVVRRPKLLKTVA
jgi:hypothetical protein